MFFRRIAEAVLCLGFVIADVMSPLTLTAQSITTGASGTVAGQCPTRISQSALIGIKDPEIRNAAASMVIDQAFINQNGGAQTMLDQTRQQIAEYDRGIAESTQAANMLSSTGTIPAPSRNPTTMLDAHVATIEKLQDAKRGTEASLPILQCWAGQPGAALGSAGTGQNAAQRAMMSNLLQQLKSGAPLDARAVDELQRQAANGGRWRTEFDELQRTAMSASAVGASDVEALARLQSALAQMRSSGPPSDLQKEFDSLADPLSAALAADPASSASLGIPTAAGNKFATPASTNVLAEPDDCPSGARQIDGSCSAGNSRDGGSNRGDPVYDIRTEEIEGPLGPTRGVASIDGDLSPADTEKFETDLKPYLRGGLELGGGPDGELLSEAIGAVDQAKEWWDKFSNTVDYTSKKIAGTTTPEDDFRAVVSVEQQVAASKYVFPNAVAGTVTGQALSAVAEAGTTALGKMDEAFRIFNEGGTADDLNSALRFEDVALAAAAQMCPLCVDAARLVQRTTNKVNNTYNAFASLFR